MEVYKKKYNVILDDMDLEEYKLRPLSAIKYIQDAFARYTATKKMAAYDMFPLNIYWVIGEFNIEFTNTAPFWSEEFEVEIWISELTKLKIYTDFKINYRNKTFAKGNACWFLINSTSKRPNKTDMVQERFKIKEELTLGEHKKFILPELKDKIGELKHINNHSDLDFNNHVNNKSYINLSDVINNKILKKKYSVKSLSVRFNQETYLNDEIICTKYSTTKDMTYADKITKNGVSVCETITGFKEKEKHETILEAKTDIKEEK